MSGACPEHVLIPSAFLARTRKKSNIDPLSSQSCLSHYSMAVENNFVESLPEEIIQTILAFCISFPSLPYTFPPCDALGNPLPGITSKTGHSRAAPLLVSKYWLRVATPLLYRSISLVDKEQARLLARTLLGNVTIASCVRSVRAAGFWNFLRCLTRVCHETEYLEIELDADGGLSSQGDLQELAATIGDLSQLDIKHFVLRKPSRAYTTCPWIITATAHLADVLPLWPNLVSTPVLPITATPNLRIENCAHCVSSPVYRNSRHSFPRHSLSCVSIIPLSQSPRVPYPTSGNMESRTPNHKP